MATDRFYGDNLNLNLPFTFDKTYPNFYSAMQDIENIFLGRYIFIRYTEKIDTEIPDNFFTDEELTIYHNFAAEATPGNKNWFIDKVYKKDEVNYHLTAWKKSVINGADYGYELVGNFDVTLPYIKAEVDYKSPAEIEEMVLEGTRQEAVTVKGNAEKEYIIVVPSARAWRIELDEEGPNFNEAGFDAETNYYDEQNTENFIRFKGAPGEDASQEEKDSYEADHRAGIKRLQIEIPAIGNAVSQAYDVIYGAASSGQLRPYYDLLANSPDDRFSTLGACINSFQKMFGKNNLIDYTEGTLPSTGSTITVQGNSYPVLNENTIKTQAVEDFKDRTDINFILYRFNNTMAQTQSGVNVSGTLCYVDKKNSYVNSEDDIDKVLLISSDASVLDGNWWFKFDSYIDLILQGQAISNGAAVAAEKLAEYGAQINTQAEQMEELGETLSQYQEDLTQAEISFPGKAITDDANKVGSEIFNLEVKDNGESGYSRETHNSISSGKYASVHGYGTSAYGDYQTVVGCYNDTKEVSGHTPLFVVGSGESSSKKQNALSVGWTKSGTSRIGDVRVNGQLQATNLLLGTKMSLSKDTLTTNGTIKVEPASTTTVTFGSTPFNLGNSKNPINNIYSRTIHTSTGDSYLQGPVRINGGSDTEVGDTKSGMLILGSASGNRMCLDENEIGAFTFNDKKQYVTRDIVIHATSLWAREGTDLGENSHPWDNFYCNYFRTLTQDKVKYVLPMDKGTVHLGSGTYKWYNVVALNGVTTTSDIRFKNVDNSDKLNLMLKTYDLLNPIAYTWNNSEEDKKLHVGLSAQQVEEKLSEVGLNPDDVYLLSKENDEYSLNYGELHGLHILKNQEQDKKIKELEDKIKVLEEKLDKLLS